MVKILLKEPVGGALGPGPTPFRQSAFIMVVDPIDAYLFCNAEKVTLSQAMWNPAMKKWIPNGLRVVIPMDNIAYAMEWRDDVGT